MRVPLSWLQELVSIDQSAEEIANKLSMAGFEVEAIEDMASQLNGVVIGFVVSKKQHPNADKLSVLEVQVGQEENLQIVCGAKNVRAGIHVPVALEGTYLPASDLKIKTSELRGVISQGMICSSQELGLKGDPSGIIICENVSSQVPTTGETFSSFLELNEIVLDLAITANRPDGLSMRGIAREVSTLFKTKILFDENNEKEEYQNLQLNKVTPDVKEETEIFSLCKINSLKERGDIPHFIERRISTAGINSINDIVDISNYLMLETGQPTHVYDHDKLEKLTNSKVDHNSFGIRKAKAGESIICIDDNVYDLDERVTVITCLDKPIAIAGVIGGKASSISKDSKTIWVESALFTPSAVRNSIKKVATRSEASSRFEKGIVPGITVETSEKIIEYLIQSKGGKVESRWCYKKQNLSLPNIHLRRSKINQILGILKEDNPQCTQESQRKGLDIDPYADEGRYLSDFTISDTLESLGCVLTQEHDGWRVSIPSYRSRDLIREIDLVEEVARIVGYDSFESRLPDPISPGGLNHRQQSERKLRTSLCSQGLQEITTLSLVSRNDSENQVSISNPLLAEASHLRTSILQEHISICARNLQSGRDNCWTFEIGNIYEQQSEGVLETKVLAGLMCNGKTLERWRTKSTHESFSFYDARGKLAAGLQVLDIQIEDRPYNSKEHLHPGRSSELFLEGRSIGYFGQLHPFEIDRLGLPIPTYVFEIKLEPILISATRPSKWISKFNQYSTLPSMERDIAVVVDKRTSSSEIVKLIRKTAKPLLETVELIDRYEGEEIAAGQCSQAFRLVYRKKDQTLTDEIVRPIHEKVREALSTKLNAKLRS